VMLVYCFRLFRNPSTAELQGVRSVCVPQHSQAVVKIEIYYDILHCKQRTREQEQAQDADCRCNVFLCLIARLVKAVDQGRGTERVQTHLFVRGVCLMRVVSIGMLFHSLHMAHYECIRQGSTRVELPGRAQCASSNKSLPKQQVSGASCRECDWTVERVFLTLLHSATLRRCTFWSGS
jgi:hypothetical protein